MGKNKITQDYRLLHRYFCGINLLVIIITVVASAMAGVSVFWITVRAGIVGFSLHLVEWVLLRTWAAWELISLQKKG